MDRLTKNCDTGGRPAREGNGWRESVVAQFGNIGIARKTSASLAAIIHFEGKSGKSVVDLDQMARNFPGDEQ